MAWRLPGKYPVVRVESGDVVAVDMGEKEERLRVAFVHTSVPRAVSESLARPDLAEEVGRRTEEFFRGAGGGWSSVEIEVEGEPGGDLPRDDDDRILAYVFREDGAFFNLHAVRQGWSAYFTKYGRSATYHKQFALAEEHSMGHRFGIWKPGADAPGRPDYAALSLWWKVRADQLGRFDERARYDVGLIHVERHYRALIEAARAREERIVFGAVKAVKRGRQGKGLVAQFEGPAWRNFELYVPPESTHLADIIAVKHAGPYKRNFVYARGMLNEWGPSVDGEPTDLRPQLVVQSRRQFWDG